MTDSIPVNSTDNYDNSVKPPLNTKKKYNKFEISEDAYSKIGTIRTIGDISNIFNMNDPLENLMVQSILRGLDRNNNIVLGNNSKKEMILIRRK